MVGITRAILCGLAAAGLNLFPAGCTPAGGILYDDTEGVVGIAADCSDGKDNDGPDADGDGFADGDGEIDCADSGCADDPACAGDDDSVGDDDMAGDDDTPAPHDPAAREGDDGGECDDGADNDQDGYFDCQDNGCNGSPDCTDDGGDDDDDTTPPAQGDYDADGDPDALDCDDSNAAIHHGAIEVCDNADNDCDGVVDEEFDQDSDGYSTCQDDCSDNNAAMHPGANEVCNDLDDDCDNAVDDDCDGSAGDDDDASTPSGVDADGDGYNAGSDCNDSNASVHPGAPEIVGDGIDQDCNGTDATNSGSNVTRSYCWTPSSNPNPITDGQSWWVGRNNGGWGLGSVSHAGAACVSVAAPVGASIILNGWSTPNWVGSSSTTVGNHWACEGSSTQRGSWTRDGSGFNMTPVSNGSGCDWSAVH